MMFEVTLLCMLCLMLFFDYMLARHYFPYDIYLLNPLPVYFLPQIVSLLLLIVLSGLDIIEPIRRFGIIALLYYVIFSCMFYFGVLFGKFLIPNLIVETKKSYKFISENSATFILVLVFIVGQIGTLLLLKGMGLNNYLSGIVSFLKNFDEFNQSFFNNSGAVLWQANIAFLFWFVFSKKNILTFSMLFFVLISILFRGAYIYLIIGAFYWLVPYLVSNGITKKFFLLAFFLFLLLNAVVFLSYSFSGDIFENYFRKIYPYVSGNLVNFIYHAENRDLSNTIIGVFSDLGFFSIISYVYSYAGLGVFEYEYLPFLEQSTNHNILGNTSTIYGTILAVPLPISIVFLFLLGVICGIFYKLSNRNLFLLSVFCFLSVASFLAFATGGHFVTTRFFPALLFIWPILLIRRLILSATK